MVLQNKTEFFEHMHAHPAGSTRQQIEAFCSTDLLIHINRTCHECGRFPDRQADHLQSISDQRQPFCTCPVRLSISSSVIIYERGRRFSDAIQLSCFPFIINCTLQMQLIFQVTPSLNHPHMYFK
ncbi:hypothetical protein AMECASPLE_034468 [Ameca splendens]|uniref:Uncharacterized protein n=1 Tax=Ameca splendens TaxID=208324 RepID=A0ABV0XVZ0_9TELE